MNHARSRQVAGVFECVRYSGSRPLISEIAGRVIG
jgi:hypothetical protein